MRDLRPDVISFGIAMDRAPWETWTAYLYYRPVLEVLF